MRFSSILGSISLLALLAVGCSDDTPSAESETGTAGTAETGETNGDGDGDPATGDGDGDPTTTTGDGDGDPTTTTGDGDGDPTGDGDGDPTGDGDGDPTGDGDGDATTTGDGDGDMMCPVGAEGCPCTGGGGCDPGLECMDGICGLPPEADPYSPCDIDDDCGQDQICVQGFSSGVEWSMCTAACQGADDCGYVDGDGCADLPGDGEFMLWCTPVTPCSFGNPCPDGMQCLPGFQDNPAVCIWPTE